MQKLLSSLFLYLIFSCNSVQKENKVVAQDLEPENLDETNQNSPQQTDLTSYITTCDTIQIDENFKVLKKRKNIRTYEVENLLYCSPTTKSKIIGEIPFNTKLVSKERISTAKETENWYKVYFNDQYGYLNKSEQIESIEPRGNLLIIGTNDGQKTIKSFSKNKPNEIVNTYDFPYSGVESRIHNYFYNGLDKTDIVVKFSGKAQRGGVESMINVKPDGEIDEIISTSYENDWEYSKWERFYYPLTFGNGKTLLVLNADFENIFNTQTTELNVIPYPKNTEVPINQLIIKIKGLDNPATDNNGKVITDDGTEEGMPILQSVKLDTTFYRWNGNKLEEITTANKDYNK